MNEALVLDDDFLPTKLRLEIFSRIRELAHTFSSWLSSDNPALNELHTHAREAAMLIAIAEAIPLSQLAQDLHLGLSGTSKLVEKLEHLDLCYRDEHLEDARLKVVNFVQESELGQVICKQLAFLAAEMDWKFSTVTQKEAEDLLALLKKL